MTYIDGFVTPVRADTSKEAYRAFAAKMAQVLKEYGARRVVECWGDDVPDGKVTDFRRSVQAADGDTVVFSWIEWPDKATRNAGMAKIMDDPRMQEEPMPFDGKRMIYGGFDLIVDTAAGEN